MFLFIHTQNSYTSHLHIWKYYKIARMNKSWVELSWVKCLRTINFNVARVHVKYACKYICLSDCNAQINMMRVRQHKLDQKKFKQQLFNYVNSSVSCSQQWNSMLILFVSFFSLYGTREIENFSFSTMTRIHDDYAVERIFFYK